MDAANILKPALARGELHLIGATTLDEYRKHIEKDPALERRFQPVLVREPSVERRRDPARAAARYEAHHGVRITDEAIVAAAELSDRYIGDRFLPDKAIDLIDQAGARVRLLRSEGRRHARSRRNRRLAREPDKATAARNTTVPRLRDEIDAQRRAGRAATADDAARRKCIAEDIAEVVSRATGIPVLG